MLHFAYFLEEFRGIPPREPPISGTRVSINWAGERPTRHCQVGICIAVSCRFSLCAIELPASCAGAAVRAPASQPGVPRNHDIDVAPPPLQLLFEVATNGPRLSAGALCMLLASSVNRHYMIERTMPELECSFEARVIAAVSSFAFCFRA